MTIPREWGGAERGPGGWIHTGFAQQLRFGAGAVESLPAVVKDIGARRVMLVTTAGRAASEEGEALARSLGRSLVHTFAEVRSHVPTSIVRSAVDAARAEDADLLVSFGGGSCADTAKAVGFFVEQERGLPGTSWLDKPALPHVGVPTTYSGAELTGGFGMTDEATRTKQGAGGPTVVPVAAIYDPVLTLGTPARVSAETGMNALAHGIEAAYSPRRTPEAEALALAAVERLVAWLPAVVDDPSDLEARTGALAGAALAARCLQNSAVGIHHGLAQLVGGRSGIPHGLANAVILAPALRFNLPAVGDAGPRIGGALGDPDDPAGAVDRLRERLGLPATLAAAGVTREDVEAVLMSAPASPAVRGNPRPAGADELREVIEAAWGG